MIRYFCDCCGYECGKLYKFEYLCHIEKDYSRYIQQDKVNGNIDEVSGRDVTKGICLTCYNKIFKTAYNKFMEIQKESINDNTLVDLNNEG